jgi:hypothetical protein
MAALPVNLPGGAGKSAKSFVLSKDSVNDAVLSFCVIDVVFPICCAVLGILAHSRSFLPWGKHA